MAGGLLRVLAGHVTLKWHNIVTLYKSWVYVYTEHEMIWVSAGETVSDRERRMIQSPKLMLTVMWNLSEFPVVKSLPKGTKFKAQSDVNNILIGISDWQQEPGEMQPKKPWLHAENA
jgi:hypothetical protein